MSEDGVRAEKCKKYQVTAHSALRLGGCVAATCDAAARFLFRVSFDFFLFAVSFKAVFFVGGVVLREQFRCVSMTKTWST